jgi:hypothetical protein
VLYPLSYEGVGRASGRRPTFRVSGSAGEDEPASGARLE